MKNNDPQSPEPVCTAKTHYELSSVRTLITFIYIHVYRWLINANRSLHWVLLLSSLLKSVLVCQSKAATADLLPDFQQLLLYQLFLHFPVHLQPADLHPPAGLSAFPAGVSLALSVLLHRPEPSLLAPAGLWPVWRKPIQTQPISSFYCNK